MGVRVFFGQIFPRKYLEIPRSISIRILGSSGFFLLLKDPGDLGFIHSLFQIVPESDYIAYFKLYRYYTIQLISNFIYNILYCLLIRIN